MDEYFSVKSLTLLLMTSAFLLLNEYFLVNTYQVNTLCFIMNTFVKTDEYFNDKCFLIDNYFRSLTE